MQTSSLLVALGGLGVLALFVYAAIRVGLAFAIRRAAGLVFVLAALTFITFILGYVTPGTPVDVLCGVKCTPHKLHLLLHLYGLDLPWWQQYARYLGNLLHFDFGLSFTEQGRSVVDIIGGGAPKSAELGVEAVAAQTLIGVPLGVLAALRSGSRTDTTLSTLSLVLLALPVFVVTPLYQIAMVQLAAHGLPSLPLAGWDTPVDRLAPVLILALTGMGVYLRLMRTAVLDVLGQDYITAARAKGLSRRAVIRRHVLPNALMPLLTVLGPSLGFVIGGLYFIEAPFNIAGMGYWSVDAAVAKDMPVLEATTLLLAGAVVLMNTVVDLAYGIVDPRVRAA